MNWQTDPLIGMLPSGCISMGLKLPTGPQAPGWRQDSISCRKSFSCPVKRLKENEPVQFRTRLWLPKIKAWTTKWLPQTRESPVTWRRKSLPQINLRILLFLHLGVSAALKWFGVTSCGAPDAPPPTLLTMQSNLRKSRDYLLFFSYFICVWFLFCFTMSNVGAVQEPVIKRKLEYILSN